MDRDELLREFAGYPKGSGVVSTSFSIIPFCLYYYIDGNCIFSFYFDLNVKHTALIPRLGFIKATCLMHHLKQDYIKHILDFYFNS